MYSIAQELVPTEAAYRPQVRPPMMLDNELLELLPGAVYVCDLDGVVVRYNRRAGELWGRYPIQGDPSELWCGSHRLFYCKR